MQKNEGYITGAAIILLLLQFHNIYYFEYKYIVQNNLNIHLFDLAYQEFINGTLITRSRIVINLIILNNILLIIFASEPKKSLKTNYNHAIVALIIGLIFMFLPFHNLIYIIVNTLGILSILIAGYIFKSVLNVETKTDIFNKENESFPQNDINYFDEPNDPEASIINIDGIYSYEKKQHKVFIPLVNIFRAVLIMGTPGSGKTFAILLTSIKQFIQKNFAMYVYDFKYPVLARSVLYYKKKYAPNSKIDVRIISFDDLRNTSQCNPIHPSIMTSQDDAIESSQSIFYNMNRSWVEKQGDFFIESPINYFAAILWFLRTYRNGVYCTFPHAQEFAKKPIQEIFPLLQASGKVDSLISPFISALKMGASEQLAGQIASAVIGLSRLSSKNIYWVTSGNDFTLNINNPENPIILIIGNNPELRGLYSSALGLFHSRLVKTINKQYQHKLAFIMDEFPTIFIKGIDNLIATGRSNLISTWLGIQDLSQFKRDYSDKEAEAIYSTIGNVISGAVTGDTAKKLSERFGQNTQTKLNISFSDKNPSYSVNESLGKILPEDTISNLSQGTFVGSIADDKKYPITKKVFHAQIRVPQEILDDEKEINKMNKQLFKETEKHKPTKDSNFAQNQLDLEHYNKLMQETNFSIINDLNPHFNNKTLKEIEMDVENNYHLIIKEVDDLVKFELNEIYKDSSQAHFLDKNYDYSHLLEIDDEEDTEQSEDEFQQKCDYDNNITSI